MLVSTASRSMLAPFLRWEYRDMTKPGVQKPHWEPCSSTMACWTGCSLPSGAARPSAVTSSLPASAASGVMQALSVRQGQLAVLELEDDGGGRRRQSPVAQPSLVPTWPFSRR